MMKNFFSEYWPDAPGNTKFWINNPREENNFAQLLKTQKALLNNELPPMRYVNDIGDGHGGGKV